jgi:hypothetical protein
MIYGLSFLAKLSMLFLSWLYGTVLLITFMLGVFGTMVIPSHLLMTMYNDSEKSIFDTMPVVVEYKIGNSQKISTIMWSSFQKIEIKQEDLHLYLGDIDIMNIENNKKHYIRHKDNSWVIDMNENFFMRSIHWQYKVVGNYVIPIYKQVYYYPLLIIGIFSGLFFVFLVVKIIQFIFEKITSCLRKEEISIKES